LLHAKTTASYLRPAPCLSDDGSLLVFSDFAFEIFAKPMCPAGKLANASGNQKPIANVKAPFPLDQPWVILFANNTDKRRLV
jgi:hypothetical protein